MSKAARRFRIWRSVPMVMPAVPVPTVVKSFFVIAQLVLYLQS